METEEQSENSLRTVALVLLCCGAVKMLHLLGVISVEGECAQVFLVSRCVLSAAWQESHRDKMFFRVRAVNTTVKDFWQLSCSALVTFAIKKRKCFPLLFLFHCLDYSECVYLLSLPLAHVNIKHAMIVNNGNDKKKHIIF